MSALAVQDFSIVLAGASVLDSVSIAIGPGQVHAVIGPNGAGKTTLLNAITAMVPRRHGHMEVAGVPCRARTADRVARAGVARTFQHAEVFHTLTAADHVRAGSLAANGRTNAACESLVRSVLGRVGTGPSASFGLLGIRMTDLARALAGNPVVLLLDEPASGLDEQERQEVLQLVSDVKQTGIAVLLIEHDIRLVLSLADQVTVLDGGRTVFLGSADDVAGDAAVSRAYLGR
jgi:ABC-type branched-subunit amino acid transport system ATPase component